MPNGNARPQERSPHDQVTVAELIARHGGSPRTPSRRSRTGQQPAYQPAPPESAVERTVRFAPVRPATPTPNLARQDRPDLGRTERVALHRVPEWAEANPAVPRGRRPYVADAERTQMLAGMDRTRPAADAERTQMLAAVERSRVPADAERTRITDAERTRIVAAAPGRAVAEPDGAVDSRAERAGHAADPEVDELYVGELLRREGRRDAEVRGGVQLRRILAAAAGVSALCGAVAFGATHLVDQSQQSASPSPDHPLRVVPGNRVTDPSDLDSALAPQREAATSAAVVPADTTTTASAGSTGPRGNAPAPGGGAPARPTATSTAPTAPNGSAAGPTRVSTSAPSAPSGTTSPTPPPSSSATTTSPPPSSSSSSGSDGGLLGPVTGLVGGLLGSPTNP